MLFMTACGNHGNLTAGSESASRGREGIAVNVTHRLWTRASALFFLIVLVPMSGFEPPTSWISTKRLYQLGYTGNNLVVDVGIKPTTFSVQRSCSIAELIDHVFGREYGHLTHLMSSLFYIDRWNKKYGGPSR
jgi:hypothetical protein